MKDRKLVLGGAPPPRVPVRVDSEPQSLFYLALGVGGGMCAQTMVVPRSVRARLVSMAGLSQANLAQGR
jgi:hypothetical protein